MNFGNLGFGEILIVLIIVLLLFGAKRIPEIAGSMGKGIREFKRNISDADRSLRDGISESRSERIAPPRERAPEPIDDDPAKEPKRLLS